MSDISFVLFETLVLARSSEQKRFKVAANIGVFNLIDWRYLLGVGTVVMARPRNVVAVFKRGVKRECYAMDSMLT
jgi:hypothetical protein